MRIKLIILMLSLCISVQSQIYTKNDFKKLVIPASCLFIAGTFDGSAEYLKFHYNGNSTFWNPSLSWHNKWKNGDPLQGEKFFLVVLH